MIFIFLTNAVLTFEEKIRFLSNSENLDPELEFSCTRQFMELIGQSIFLRHGIDFGEASSTRISRKQPIMA